MTVGAFLRQFASDTGLSVVWAEALDESLISLSVEDIPAKDVLMVVARRLNVSLAEYGRLYFLGEPKKTDRAYFVGKVLRAKVDEIEPVLNAVKTEQGVVTVLQDGSVIVADEIEAIRKAAEIVQKLQSLDVSVWAVQLYLLQETNTDIKTTGLDIQDDIRLAVLLSDVDSATNYKAELDAALRCEIERSDVRIVARPLLLLVDGGKASLQKVESIPVPQYTTSETGAVSVSGYQNVDVGFNFAVSLRDWGREQASLVYDLQLGEVSGYVDESIPIETKDVLTGETVIASGGVYLLGSLQRSSATNTTSGFAGLTRTKQHRNGILRVWAKVERIQTQAGAQS